MPKPAAPKSYKAELIIAVITALTGITVSVITNWDKFFSSKEREREITCPGSVQSYEALEYADKMVADGWNLEINATTSVPKDSILKLPVDFVKGFHYEVCFYNEDPDLEIGWAMTNSFTNRATELHVNSVSFINQISSTNENYNQLFIKAKSKKPLVTLGVLVLSKL